MAASCRRICETERRRHEGENRSTEEEWAATGVINRLPCLNMSGPFVKRLHVRSLLSAGRMPSFSSFRRQNRLVEIFCKSNRLARALRTPFPSAPPEGPSSQPANGPAELESPRGAATAVTSAHCLDTKAANLPCPAARQMLRASRTASRVRASSPALSALQSQQTRFLAID